MYIKFSYDGCGSLLPVFYIAVHLRFLNHVIWLWKMKSSCNTEQLRWR